MRIKTIRIQNFRSFDDLSVSLENFTSLVGPNGAGKSTILCALNIFFREIDGTPPVRPIWTKRIFTIATLPVRLRSPSRLVT
ncbi:AAA family ATPase [Aminobacter anthyllidis]|uniref:AAA family ATPase n=1 Tax=Aminobacter anthyllidis TaxID=1035067 RepID=UPI003CC8032A